MGVLDRLSSRVLVFLWCRWGMVLVVWGVVLALFSDGYAVEVFEMVVLMAIIEGIVNFCSCGPKACGKNLTFSGLVDVFEDAVVENGVV
ncbi:hypothetical protein J1N35_012012 [Gossypium stocksii]|uniref:Transmembrane protein n=1 Tax=Gossypium stocksii TaxID=47602 RepID=A0A9D3W3C0_9ROSI|nr:hypothetical protein J1N35_012012 [Gossypium stocksii]